MKLSTRGDYAVRALLELSTSDGEVMPLSEIAERTRIPSKYLEQILMRLRTARLVRGKRGARGGYMLARDPQQVTVGEVIRVMEGPLAPSLCASQTAHSACPAYRCPSEESCVMRGLWAEVRDAIAGIVDQTTFGDLAQRTQQQRSVQRAMYYI
jgi:Rrf2 family protein